MAGRPQRRMRENGRSAPSLTAKDLWDAVTRDLGILPDEEGDLWLAGVVTGDRHGVPEGHWRGFRRTWARAGMLNALRADRDTLPLCAYAIDGERTNDHERAAWGVAQAMNARRFRRAREAAADIVMMGALLSLEFPAAFAPELPGVATATPWLPLVRFFAAGS